MAVGAVELVRCRPAVRANHQPLRARQIRMSANYDSLHGMDGGGNLHSILLTLARCIVVWRGHVRHPVGSLPGKSYNSQIILGRTPTNIFPTQTLSTVYASEVVPVVLRPYVTAYVCMCWGAGILLSSGVVRAVASLDGDLAWRLPFALQWVWPIPLLIGAYLAPESPWNAVRRGKIEMARQSLMRLREDTPEKEREVNATLAYIQHTTALEQAETVNASFWECFQGTNLRRTEIVCALHPLPLCILLTDLLFGRTVLSGLHKSYVATQSSGTLSSFSKPPALPNYRRLTLIFLSLPAILSVE
jgi:hypothetical protein